MVRSGELNSSGVADVGVAEFALGQPSLDEVFFALTGRAPEEIHADETDSEEEDAA